VIFSSLAQRCFVPLWQALKQTVRQSIKPDNHCLALNAALDMTRSKPELVLENALLRQQLLVLQRQVQRPKLSWHDRTLIVLLASKLRAWKHALIIVQPDTVLRWHRDLIDGEYKWFGGMRTPIPLPGTNLGDVMIPHEWELSLVNATPPRAHFYRFTISWTERERLLVGLDFDWYHTLAWYVLAF
jgi:hypothetical protein